MEYDKTNTKSAINAAEHIKKHGLGQKITISDLYGNWKSFEPHQHQEAIEHSLRTK